MNLENQKNKKCCKCLVEKNRKYFHKDSRHKDKLDYVCKECRYQYNKKRRILKKDEIKNYQDKYAEEHREEAKEYQRQYRQNNKAKRNFWSRNRETRKQKAMPTWLSKEYLQEIKNYYLEARAKTDYFGVEFQVDHIIPLKGKNISGLHVPWNLRVITKEENMRKKNNVEQ